MRKNLIFFSCLLLVTGTFAQQFEKKPSSLGFSIAFSDFIAAQDIQNSSISDAKIGGFSKMNTGFMVQYWKGLGKKLDLSLGYSGAFLTKLPVDFPVQTSDYYQSLDAAFNLKMLQEKALFNPFLTAGIGGYNYSSKYGAQAPLGFGLQINPFGSSVNILAQSQYRVNLSDSKASHLHHSFGVLAPLTDPKPKVIPPPPPPADTDMDGVIDADDKCATVFGLAKYNGCPIPDTDKDGINDEQDKCPAVAGLAKYNGCPIPDTDKDGVNDEEDKCLTVAGFPRYNGCPIPDTDGDGVNDEDDKCPNRVGPAENFGCPIIGIKSYEIVFKTGSAILLQKGKNILDTVVTYLNNNPSVSVSITGYTDNTGSDKINQPLSVKRADATKAYLVSKGINADRMTTAGYGSSDPIADNKTAKGRAMNRRIEIKIQ